MTGSLQSAQGLKVLDPFTQLILQREHQFRAIEIQDHDRPGDLYRFFRLLR